MGKAVRTVWSVAEVMEACNRFTTFVTCDEMDVRSSNYPVAPVKGARYIEVVRVVARSTLSGFVRNHVVRGQQKTVTLQLDSWYDATIKAEWNNSAELKAQFGSASIVSSERVVFNIKGNDYRLIVRVNYDYQAVRILWLGTHREYDKIDAREVEYDKSRYADSTSSQ